MARLAKNREREKEGLSEVWCGFENHFWLQRVLKIGTLGFNDCMSGGGSGLGLGQGRCQCVCTSLLLIIQRSRKKGQIIDYKTLSRSNFAALCLFVLFVFFYFYYYYIIIAVVLS